MYPIPQHCNAAPPRSNTNTSTPFSTPLTNFPPPPQPFSNDVSHAVRVLAPLAIFNAAAAGITGHTEVDASIA